MRFDYRSCVIYVTASLDGSDIVSHACIYYFRSDAGDLATSTHEMEFHSDFLDENEAIAFASNRARKWVDEHAVLTDLSR
jgi:hypothetical protein